MDAEGDGTKRTKADRRGRGGVSANLEATTSQDVSGSAAGGEGRETSKKCLKRQGVGGNAKKGGKRSRGEGKSGVKLSGGPGLCSESVLR